MQFLCISHCKKLLLDLSAVKIQLTEVYGQTQTFYMDQSSTGMQLDGA